MPKLEWVLMDTNIIGEPVPPSFAPGRRKEMISRIQEAAVQLGAGWFLAHGPRAYGRERLKECRRRELRAMLVSAATRGRWTKRPDPTEAYNKLAREMGRPLIETPDMP